VVSKTYDGLTTATLGAVNYSASGLVGDVITLNNPLSGTYDTKDVGSGKLVTVSGVAVASAQDLVSGKPVYGYPGTVGVLSGPVGTIGSASVSAITGITTPDRAYDGSTTATLTTTGAVFAGMAAGDSLTVGGGVGAYGDKSVGNAKPVAITGLSLGGTDAGNYTLLDTTSSTTGNITPATVSAITGITAANKVYDGTTTAVLNATGAAFTGRIGSDVLTVGSATGNFSDKNVGSPKAVAITGLTLGGTDAGNYTLASTTASASAAISVATITAVNGITASKTYDGTTTATPVTTGATFAGMVPGDSLTVGGASATFADRNVGVGKTLNLTGISLGGLDQGNYTLASTSATGSGTIVQRTLSTWTGSAGDGLWSNPLNWDAIPDASNVANVSIPSGAGSITFDSSVAATTLQNLNSSSLLNITSGSLQITTALGSTDFSQSGGSLSGAGSMMVSNSFSQTGGSIAVGGAVSLVQNSGNLSFTSLQAPSVTLAAPAGAISQSGPVVAPTLVAVAQNGINLSNPSNQFGVLVAQNQGSGDIVVANSGPLVLAGVDNTGGGFSLTNAGSVTVAAPVTITTSIDVVASGAGSDIQLGAFIAAGTTAAFNAGRDITVSLGPVAPGGVTYLYGGSFFDLSNLAQALPVDPSVATVTDGVLILDDLLAAIDTNPDGTPKKKNTDGTIVTEGEICR
jgi:hypothetical protein